MSGFLIVDADDRTGYLEECRTVVEQGRAAPGCLDFALSPDLIDPTRINILERWERQEDVEAFRGDGVGDEQGARILSARVAEYDVEIERLLT